MLSQQFQHRRHSLEVGTRLPGKSVDSLIGFLQNVRLSSLRFFAETLQDGFFVGGIAREGTPSTIARATFSTNWGFDFMNFREVTSPDDWNGTFSLAKSRSTRYPWLVATWATSGETEIASTPPASSAARRSVGAPTPMRMMLSSAGDQTQVVEPHVSGQRSRTGRSSDGDLFSFQSFGALD